MDEVIFKRDAINAIKEIPRLILDSKGEFQLVDPTTKAMIDPDDAVTAIKNVSPAQSEQFVDADKLKSCRFEYINACKIVARPTPDTSKNDIYDANAVIKALHPIFGDVEF